MMYGCKGTTTIDNVIVLTPQDSSVAEQLTCERTHGLVDINDKVNPAYYTFKRTLSSRELTYLVENEDKCLKIYAFSALVDQHYQRDSIETIIRRHINDTTSINYVSGDQVEEWTVISFMIANSQLDHTTQRKYGDMIPVPKEVYHLEPVEIELKAIDEH